MGWRMVTGLNNIVPVLESLGGPQEYPPLTQLADGDGQVATPVNQLQHLNITQLHLNKSNNTSVSYSFTRTSTTTHQYHTASPEQVQQNINITQLHLNKSNNTSIPQSFTFSPQTQMEQGSKSFAMVIMTISRIRH